MSSDSTEVEYTLTINTELVSGDIRKLEVSLMRILSYIERLTGGNPNLEKLINIIQKVITTIRSLQIALNTFNTAVALSAAGLLGPVGWLYLGSSIAGAAFSGYSMYESLAGM